jgi:hypothetical protein
MKNINITAQPDGKTVTIEIPEMSLHLNSTDVDNFITALATARRGLSPEAATSPPENRQVLATANPHYTVQNSDVTGAINVGLRELGYGWQWFHFTQEHARAFIEAMNKHTELSAATPRTLN